jgi:DsbC/DsbD-like thiol-disulfide interchange protein
MFPKTAISAIGAVALATLSALPAGAVDSGWTETEGARVRLVVDPEPDQDSITRGALEIELAEGWKTYWIDPGASGIPPQIDLSRSEGIELTSLRLPPPVRVDDGYSVWAGYKHPVSLALEMRRTGAAEVKADVFLGLCEKICVPFQASFDLSLPAPDQIKGTDARAKVAIAGAFSALPADPTEDFDVIAAETGENADAITIRVRVPAEAADDPEIFVHGPDGWLFGTPKTISKDTGTVAFSLVVESRPKAGASDIPLDIVVTLGERAIETTVPLATN